MTNEFKLILGALRRDLSRDRSIIRGLGGASEVAKLLGFSNYWAQRVQQWMNRGIPLSIKVAHPHLFILPPSGQTDDGKPSLSTPLNKFESQ